MLTNIIYSTITAYCLCSQCCPSSSKGITASCLMPKQGITIAVPRNIPLNSVIILDGHSYIAQDRMSQRFTNRFDVFFSSHKRALEFGIKRNQQVTIITK